jgi:Icc-related predicted phosphoesterase
MTTIVAISDTHEQHAQVVVPDGDILIHAGDFTNLGKIGAIGHFASWLSAMPHKYKIVVPGNHDWAFQNEFRGLAVNLLQQRGIIYLEDTGCRINNLQFYGSPHQPRFHDWAFNIDRNSLALAQKWDMIPEDTNILITHCPPYGILDDTIRAGSQGCELLAKRLPQLTNLKVHIFGHLHRDGGKMVERDGVKFVNAAICTDYYKPDNLPVVVEV